MLPAVVVPCRPAMATVPGIARTSNFLLVDLLANYPLPFCVGPRLALAWALELVCDSDRLIDRRLRGIGARPIYGVPCDLLLSQTLDPLGQHQRSGRITSFG